MMSSPIIDDKAAAVKGPPHSALRHGWTNHAGLLVIEHGVQRWSYGADHTGRLWLARYTRFSADNRRVVNTMRFPVPPHG